MLSHGISSVAELSAEQRQRVVEVADRAFHRDHDPWPVIRLHLTTAALAAVAIVVFYYWTGVFAPLVALPTLVFALALSRHRAIRRPRPANGWMLAIYAFITALLLLIVAAFVGWQAFVVNMIAIIADMAMMLRVSRQWMQPYVWRALRDLGMDDLCPACGYRLLGLPRTTVQCPECGEVRTFPRDECNSRPARVE